MSTPPLAAGSASPGESEPAPAHTWRWQRFLLLTVAVLITLGAGVYLVRTYRMANRLRACLATLDQEDPGWRLAELEQARAVVPEGENSAPVVQLCKREWRKSLLGDEVRRQLDEVATEEQLSPEVMAGLAKALDEQTTAVGIGRRLADLPRGRHWAHYTTNRLRPPLTYQIDALLVRELMHQDAILLAQAGDLHAALRSCRACLNAGRSLGDEPTYASQRIRVSCVSTAVRATERVLAQGKPESADLKGLQELLADELAFPGWKIALRGKRAANHELLKAVAAGQAPAAEVDDQSRSVGLAVWDNWAVRGQARAIHPFVLDLMTEQVRIDDLPVPEQLVAEKQLDAKLNALPKTSLPRLLIPSGRSRDSFRRPKALLASAVAALAAERYRQEKGDWPTTLEALTPGYLPAIPVDPYCGKPVAYRRLADSVVVYSVGPDGLDNDGKFDREPLNRPGTDLGIRLWDVQHRRQPPRPRTPVPRVEE